MASYLIPDRVDKIKIGSESISINVKIIPDTATAHKYIADWVEKGDKVKPCKKLNDGTGKPKGICIHNTNYITTNKATNPAEQYTRATYPNGNMGGAVVHYYVYKSHIWQELNDNERGWHAGDGTSRKASQRTGEKIGGNLDCISIEIIEDKQDVETEKTAAMLTAYLLKKHGLKPETDIYTHKYFSNKNCPKVILPYLSEFKAQVKGFYNLIGSESDKYEILKEALNQAVKDVESLDSVKRLKGLLNE